MISVYQIKPAFQKILQPLLRSFYRLGITANQITIAAIFLSIGLGSSFMIFHDYRIVLLILPLGLLLRMALNALDGMMAKQFNMQSKLGEVLNELGDVISDLAIILPFVILPHTNASIIILFAVLSVLNEFSGVIGKAIGGERRYDGPMGKSDRALLIGIFCITAFFWNSILIYTNWIFGIASILVIVSTITRLKNSLSWK